MVVSVAVGDVYRTRANGTVGKKSVMKIVNVGIIPAYPREHR